MSTEIVEASPNDSEYDVNAVNITKGPQRSHTDMIKEKDKSGNMQRSAGNKAAWDDQDTEEVVGHEFGHTAGVEDRYQAHDEIPGKTQPLPGFKGNVMADNGPEIKESQIEEIIQDPRNKVTCDLKCP